MSEGLGAMFPKEYKFISVGVTIGIVIGIGLSFVLLKPILIFLLVGYLVLSAVGLYGLKDEIRRIFK